MNGENALARGEGSAGVSVQSDGPVAVVRLSNPPVNALTAQMRAALIQSFKEIDADPHYKAVVIVGEGGSLCGGSDTTSPAAEEDAPSLSELCRFIETFQKPVVASIHGATIGAGVALAMAAHFRVMGRAARVSLPDITLGLVPGGGATQRLPRLVGADMALDLLLSGRAIDAVQAEKIGLIDQVAQARAGEAALGFTHRLVTEGAGPRPTAEAMQGLSDPQSYMQELAKRRQQVAPSKLDAPGQIIDCVEAALLMPFEVGLGREETARRDCLNSPQYAALLHASYAERRAARPVGFDAAAGQPVSKLAVIGTGTIAMGVAVVALDRGIPVVMLGSDADELVLAHQRVETVYKQALQRGKISADDFDKRLGLFQTTLDLKLITDCTLVLEATVGGPAQRARVLIRLEEFMPPDAVLATIADRGFSQMAQALGEPERFLGLHFFAPVQLNRVAELVRFDSTKMPALATAHGFLRRLGITPVTVTARDGLAANVVQEAGWFAVDMMLLMGARPAQIDKALRDYGFSVGPCFAMDALGLAHLSGAVAQHLAGLGRQGRSAGQGFYDYPEGQQPDDRACAALLDQLRHAGGVPKTDFSDADIVERYILAQANAGARLLEAGAVQHPVDIDVLMMVAKGYPRWHGGPMKSADLIAPLQAHKKLQSFAIAAPDIWEPAGLWRNLIKNGDRFEDLNKL